MPCFWTLDARLRLGVSACGSNDPEAWGARFVRESHQSQFTSLIMSLDGKLWEVLTFFVVEAHATAVTARTCWACNNVPVVNYFGHRERGGDFPKVWLVDVIDRSLKAFGLDRVTADKLRHATTALISPGMP